MFAKATKLSITGFSHPSHAESWFPKENFFDVDGTTVTRNTYGAGKARMDGKKQILDFALETSSGTKTGLQIRQFTNNGTATANLITGPKYVSTIPTRYKCQ